MSKLLVQMTESELEALLARAVAKGVAEAKPEPAKYLTLEKVAKMLDLDERTVTTYIRLRGLPATKLGHEWRFESRELAQWMADNKFKAKKAS